jgi:geranylgeranyl pyrophosphate synthase
MKPEFYLTALNIHDREINEYLDKVDGELRPYLIKTAEWTPRVYPLTEGVSIQIATGKRRLRAAFCTTSCELFCGSYKPALYFAAAIEHLQNSMLIHEEIVKSPKRNLSHQPIWRRFGIGQAINIGDVFISLSTLSILESPYTEDLKIKLLELICSQGFEATEGLNMDINLSSNKASTIDDYIKCAKKKTGSFLAMAAKGGAIIGGAGKDMIQLLDNYALMAGVAYEIGEDILDVRPSMNRLRGLYIKKGRPTLLSIYAAENTSSKERKKLFSILNKHHVVTTDEDVNWVCQLYEKTGAISYGERIVRTITQNLLRHITKFPESEAKYKLLRITKYYGQRFHLQHPQ